MYNYTHTHTHTHTHIKSRMNKGRKEKTRLKNLITIYCLQQAHFRFRHKID